MVQFKKGGTFMKFMERFNALADRTLVPLANKLGNQRHLAAIRDGMVVTNSIIYFTGGSA